MYITLIMMIIIIIIMIIIAIIYDMRQLPGDGGAHVARAVIILISRYYDYDNT